MARVATAPTSGPIRAEPGHGSRGAPSGIDLPSGLRSGTFSHPRRPHRNARSGVDHSRDLRAMDASGRMP
jgi:hypothetical protein